MFIQALYALRIKVTDLISHYFKRDDVIVQTDQNTDPEQEKDIHTDFGSVNTPSYASTPRVLSGKPHHCL